MLQLWLVANTVAWPFNLKLGDLTLNLNVVILLVCGVIWLWRRRMIASSSAKMLIFFVGYLAFSLYFAATGPCDDKLLKSIISAPILAFLVLIGWEAGRTARKSDWLNLQKAALCALLLAFAGFLVEMAAPSWFPNQAGYRT